MDVPNLEVATRNELYLEIQRGRLQETEGKCRKQAAMAVLHRRFPAPTKNGPPATGKTAGKSSGK